MYLLSILKHQWCRSVEEIRSCNGVVIREKEKWWVNLGFLRNFNTIFYGHNKYKVSILNTSATYHTDEFQTQSLNSFHVTLYVSNFPCHLKVLYCWKTDLTYFSNDSQTQSLNNFLVSLCFRFPSPSENSIHIFY